MLTVYTMDQPDQWDGIVRSFSHYDTYWLSGYVKAFQIHGDGEPLLFHYENDKTRGINVVMKRDIAKDKHFSGKIQAGEYYDFASPYGYGGWLIEGNDTIGLFEAYDSWTRQNQVISEFVRFHPILKNHEFCEGYYQVTGMGDVVHMNLSSPETIWENLTSKNRNMIRKARKNGVRIYYGRFQKIYERFLEIYNTTMDRDNAEAYYYFQPAFYQSILEDLPRNAQVFWAEKDGKTIAASIILSANGMMNYHLSGSLREFSTFAPSNLILYEAALWGCENGYRTFYLGGGVGSGEDSLFHFKRAFYKGELHRFYIGKRIFNQGIYDSLVNMREKAERNYFPEYRA